MRSVRSTASRAVALRPGAAGSRPRGQSLAEFALVLTPLMLLLLGIVQMGFVFNAYVTMSNAAREGARTATIYVYDRNQTKAQNDAARETAARNALVTSLGVLNTTTPQYVESEQLVTYSLPTGVTETDTRKGQNVTVRGRYHLDMLIPFIGALLPLQNGRLTIDSNVTMVIN